MVLVALGSADHRALARGQLQRLVEAAPSASEAPVAALLLLAAIHLQPGPANDLAVATAALDRLQRVRFCPPPHSRA